MKNEASEISSFVARKFNKDGTVSKEVLIRMGRI